MPFIEDFLETYKDAIFMENAYCAGLFDGEGWITIKRISKKAQNQRLEIGIGLTQSGPLEKFKEKFGGILNSRTRVGYKWKKFYTLRIMNRKEQFNFINIILPFLQIKNKQAKLALEFLETVTYKTITSETFIKREKLRLEMLELNK